MSTLRSRPIGLLHALLARLDQRTCLPISVLDDLVAGTLSSTDAGRAFDHLQQCLSCVNAFTRLQSLRESPSPAGAYEDTRSAGRRELPQLIDTPSTHALRAELRRLARFDRGPGAAPPILITGENGIGKGILARAIHGLSRRAAAPFVVVPCLALPADLLEVEIFGDERRALGSPRPGLLELANGGTLLLDGVHRIPLDLQARLLEALEERLVRRLGGSAPRSLEVRVIAATDVDLERAVRSGAFRKDLLQRLNRLTLPVRPLRERPDDIVPLARHFANRFARLRGLPHVRLTSGAERRLRAHTWPGNVRELSRVMERAAARRAGEEIGVDDLQLPGRAPRRPRTRMP